MHHFALEQLDIAAQMILRPVQGRQVENRRHLHHTCRRQLHHVGSVKYVQCAERLTLPAPGLPINPPTLGSGCPFVQPSRQPPPTPETQPRHLAEVVRLWSVNGGQAHPFVKKHGQIGAQGPGMPRRRIVYQGQIPVDRPAPDQIAQRGQQADCVAQDAAVGAVEDGDVIADVHHTAPPARQTRKRRVRPRCQTSNCSRRCMACPTAAAPYSRRMSAAAIAPRRAAASGWA